MIIFLMIFSLNFFSLCSYTLMLMLLFFVRCPKYFLFSIQHVIDLDNCVCDWLLIVNWIPIFIVYVQWWWKWHERHVVFVFIIDLFDYDYYWHVWQKIFFWMTLLKINYFHFMMAKSIPLIFRSTNHIELNIEFKVA
jgi:hypothetical protein